MKKWVIWGAGENGRSVCQLLTKCGETIVSIVDMNLALSGERIEGVTVEEVDSLKKYDDIYVCVTVDGKIAEITETLNTVYGITGKRVEYYAETILELYRRKIEFQDFLREQGRRFIFECANGLELGGVETWTETFGEEVRLQGEKAYYLIPEGRKGENHSNLNFIEINHCNNFMDYGNLDMVCALATGLINMLPATLIINYKDAAYLIACLIKEKYPERLTLISVLHGGKQSIIDWNRTFSKYIDRFIGVAQNGICNKIQSSGIPSDKIVNIVCPVEIDECLHKTYSNPDERIRIAYAGRLTLQDKDKRSDLLIPLIEELMQCEIEFELSIAGAGDYFEVLKSYVEDHGYENEVQLLGQIPHERMKDFWNEHDIFVNVSDSEGNCMAMLEAMAQGCVPVLTDVSGVRDSITDSYNGYIHPVRDMKGIAQSIEKLAGNRELLIELGQRAHKAIYSKYENRRMQKLFMDTCVL